MVNDHLNLPGLAGNHPLRGPNEDAFGTRFPAMSNAYDMALRRSVFEAAASTVPLSPGRTLHEGTYAFVSGPSFETAAEARLLQALGADVVGMSTVPEVVVAHHCGFRVLCVSLVTNKVICSPAPSAREPETTPASTAAEHEQVANHAEVLAASNEAATDMQGLVQAAITACCAK